MKLASVLYYGLNERSESLNRQYLLLLREFRESGDYDLFSELYNDLLRLEDQARELKNPEEQGEIVNHVTSLRNAIGALFYSAY